MFQSPRNSLNDIDPSIANVDQLFKYALSKIRIEQEEAEKDKKEGFRQPLTAK